MNPTTLESLEMRVAALEKTLAQVVQAHAQPLPEGWKDWRLAVGKVTRTDIAEEIDAAGRKIREADRRKSGA